MRTQPLELTRDFSESISRTRISFIRSMRKLPDGLAVLAEQHFEDRMSRARGRPLLGEYAPWLIADLLGLSDHTAVKRLATAWLHIYSFTLMLDDVIDDPQNHRDPGHVLVASLMLQRGLSGLFAYSSDPKKLKNSIDAASLGTAAAAVHELAEHRHRFKSFSPGEVSALGQKFALLRICVDAMAGSSNRWSDVRSLRKAVYCLATGMQLLDDLTDVNEDLVQGNFTLPLTVAFEQGFLSRKFKRVNRRRSYDELLISLVQSGAIERTLDAANEAFASMSRAIRRDPIASQSRIAIYVDELREHITSTRASAARLASLLPSNPSTRVRRSKQLSTAIEELEQHLQVVAQST